MAKRTLDVVLRDEQLGRFLLLLAELLPVSTLEAMFLSDNSCELIGISPLP